MSQLQDRIRKSEHYDGGDNSGGQGDGSPKQVESPTEAVAPVISLEKTDVQFWCDVLTVVLLILIWRELTEGSR